VLREIEQKLRKCWRDKRLFEIWAEYYTAVQIRERNPRWEVQVSPNIRDDVVCTFKNGEEKLIKIQVKTGKWSEWSSKKYGLKLTGADACFSPFQIENVDSFQYAVFFIHENYQKTKWKFVFSRNDLIEIKKRKGNRATPYYVSKVESLEDYEKWQNMYDPPESIYKLEKYLVEKPEIYLERWDKIE
jgi:hypothetical protein